MKRNRIIYFFIVVCVMALGIFTRKMWRHLPDFINACLGDVIWAVMIYFMIAFLLRRSSAWKVGLVAILFCYAIEVSQLYHAAWIDNIRQTTLGALVLGFGFLWSDIAAYTIGVGLSVGMELAIEKSKRSRPK